MTGFPSFSLRTEILILASLVVVSAIFLSLHITRPLTDYDEAIYANRIVGTLASGHVLTMYQAGHPELDKPPLYFWSVMPLVSLFGPKEWTFRLPAIITAIISLVLTYLLARKITESQFAAVTSFLVLLSSPWFYFFAIEARLDFGVISAILAALLAVVSGWENERRLIWFFPLIAIGFLIKSIIALLAIPIALIYAAVYGQWSWLRNRHLWTGAALGLLIAAPWHLWQTWQFGTTFWQAYLFDNLGRTTATFTGTHGVGDYIYPVVTHMPIWFWSLAALCIAFAIVCVSKTTREQGFWRLLVAPLTVVVFIFTFFTASRTHLGAYVLPAYPFIALFAGAVARKSLPFDWGVKSAIVLTLLLISGGTYYCFSIPWTAFQDQARFVRDEMTIGMLYKDRQAEMPGKLYSVLWSGFDTLTFYSGTTILGADPRGPTRVELKPPFYVVTTNEVADILHSKSPDPLQGLEAVYRGTSLLLLYSDQPLTIGG